MGLPRWGGAGRRQRKGLPMASLAVGSGLAVLPAGPVLPGPPAGSELPAPAAAVGRLGLRVTVVDDALDLASPPVVLRPLVHGRGGDGVPLLQAALPRTVVGGLGADCAGGLLVVSGAAQCVAAAPVGALVAPLLAPRPGAPATSCLPPSALPSQDVVVGGDDMVVDVVGAAGEPARSGRPRSASPVDRGGSKRVATADSWALVVV